MHATSGILSQSPDSYFGVRVHIQVYVLYPGTEPPARLPPGNARKGVAKRRATLDQLDRLLATAASRGVRGGGGVEPAKYLKTPYFN